MEYPDYLKELMKELTATEFLKVAMQKLDEINIKTEDELLLLDKLLYKTSNISKDYKMRMLSPELQEKFNQRMEDMKLDQNNFLNMLKTYKNSKGPYSNPKKDTAVPATQDTQDKAADPTPDTSDKSYRSQRSVDRTPRRKRSESSSSSSSSTGSGDRRSSKDKRTSEKRLPSKYSFSLKKPDSASRIVRSHDQDEYFESRSSHGYESRPSERDEESARDFRRSPPKYFRSRGLYRGTKKIFRPPRGFKH